MEVLKQELNDLILELNSLCETIIGSHKVITRLEENNHRNLHDDYLKQLLILIDEYKLLTDKVKSKINEYNTERRKLNLPEEIHYIKLLRELDTVRDMEF